VSEEVAKALAELKAMIDELEDETKQKRKLSKNDLLT